MYKHHPFGAKEVLAKKEHWKEPLCPEAWETKVVDHNSKRWGLD